MTNVIQTSVIHEEHDACNQRAFASPSCEIEDDGKSCTLRMEDGFQSKFHSVWLRHNCHCEQCRHVNGQRLINSAIIPHSIKVDKAVVNDEKVEITWKGEENHKGILPIRFLRDNNYNQETLLSIRKNVKMNEAVTEIPFVHYEDIIQSKEEYLRWLKQINESGLSLVKGVPIRKGMVKEVGQMIAPVWRYMYEEIFDVISVADPINVAYTRMKLAYHMDLVYFESPPGLQLLHCLRFDDKVEGGLSTFVDIFTVAEKFQAQYPDHFHTFTTVPATFQKIHYERDEPVHIVNQKPHIKLNHTGEIVAVYWSPPFEGPLNVPEKDVERYYAAYEIFAKLLSTSHELTHKFCPGDLIVFNNLRIVHGRTGFTLQGDRHLQGCYINIDLFKSQTQVYNNIYGDGKLVKRVGNQCWR